MGFFTGNKSSLIQAQLPGLMKNVDLVRDFDPHGEKEAHEGNQRSFNQERIKLEEQTTFWKRLPLSQPLNHEARTSLLAYEDSILASVIQQISAKNMPFLLEAHEKEKSESRLLPIEFQTVMGLLGPKLSKEEVQAIKLLEPMMSLEEKAIWYQKRAADQVLMEKEYSPISSFKIGAKATVPYVIPPGIVIAAGFGGLITGDLYRPRLSI